MPSSAMVIIVSASLSEAVIVIVLWAYFKVLLSKLLVIYNDKCKDEFCIIQCFVGIYIFHEILLAE